MSLSVLSRYRISVPNPIYVTGRDTFDLFVLIYWLIDSTRMLNHYYLCVCVKLAKVYIHLYEL